MKFKKKRAFLLTYVIRRIISQNVPVLGSVRLIGLLFSLKDFLKTFLLIYVHKCAVKLVHRIELFEDR